jgi:hypothetical protein
MLNLFKIMRSSWKGRFSQVAVAMGWGIGLCSLRSTFTTRFFILVELLATAQQCWQEGSFIFYFVSVGWNGYSYEEHGYSHFLHF